MKKFVIMMIMIFVFALPAGSVTLKISYEPWLPLIGIPDTEEQGYAVEIIKAIFGDYKLNFEEFPYVRGIRLTESGTTDILLGVCDFEIDKTKVVFPQEVIGMIRPTFFVRHDNQWQYKGPESLKGIRLGLIHGYDYREFDDFPDKTGFIYISGDDTTIRSLGMLLKDRISVFYEERNVVQYYAVKIGEADKIRAAGSVVEAFPFYIAICKKRPDAEKLADKFDTEIRRMRSSKQLDKILQKYSLTDWK